ncbi:hypothetical protein IWC96_05260 [Brevundimonas sp. BAL450]|uniref:hypothetical protein n=1 Tax=Brevundimonas sp. BAL450 TaxID=1708162 RepID=UPI0018C980A2|nr:hypothetical protein [Brevundimonas sp. BAL450]MBG7614690.1 hypothetical protein [Brevundimonas sp. BAL450]
MPDAAIPDIPKGSRFGWPRPARLEEFKTRLEAKGLPTDRVVFQGLNQDLPIIRIPIDLPKYRMANGRTASLQVEHLAMNPGLRSDLFTGDPEMWDAQEAQHELLLKLGRLSDLDGYFEDAAHQQVNPLLLDENGFVVNGNRRLSMWRQLLHDEPEKYGHFEHIEVVVLPHATEKDLNRLEAQLQIEKDIRADYSWDAQANMMVAKMERDGIKAEELCKLYRMKDAEFAQLLDMRTYADEYLRSRDKANMWSEVSGQEHTFQRLVQSRSRLSGVARKEVFKEAAFALIDEPASVGRLYIAIPDLAANLDKVVDRLAAELELETATPDDDLDELFGAGKADDEAGARETGLINALKDPQQRSVARDTIADVLETERQLKKDVKKAGYLLDQCAKANSFLTVAAKDGLRPESKLTGVSKQLDEIEARVATIRAYLAEHA